jgi:hypothetical protein
MTEVSTCNARGKCATKGASAGNKNNIAAACLCFRNYLAFFQLKADRTDYVIQCVVKSSY